MSFSSIQNFRSHATEEDMKALETFIMSQDNRTDAFPNADYNFTYSTAARELRSHGYLGGLKETNATNEIDEFIIKTLPRNDFTSRSFSVSKDVLERIDKLANDNWQYSKKAIINKLLDDALKKYRY